MCLNGIKATDSRSWSGCTKGSLLSNIRELVSQTESSVESLRTLWQRVLAVSAKAWLFST